MISYLSHLTSFTMPERYQLAALSQRGFTLLEMVLVLFLIGLLASAGLLFTEGVEDQAKYDETKRRMELIRKAIIGDSTRTINGAPEVSGFAADMGRLPGCIRELLVNESCDGVAIDPWSVDTDTGIGFGWRGPYIQVIADRDGEVRYRDGYGSLTPYGYSGLDADGIDELNSKNFGWQWLLFDESDNALNLTEAKSAVRANLQSLGFDVIDPIDDIPNGDIEDISSFIAENDWLTDDKFTISFHNTSSLSSVDVELDDWNISLGKSNVPEFLNFSVASGASSVSISPEASVEVIANFENKIPMGVYFLTVCQVGAPVCPDDATSAYQIVLLPKHHIAPFPWRISP